MFFSPVFGSSTFSMRSRSFCLLFAWAAFVAFARFFSMKRSSWARRSVFAFALRASCSSRAFFSATYRL